jgi:hypothetical protein
MVPACRLDPISHENLQAGEVRQNAFKIVFIIEMGFLNKKANCKITTFYANEVVIAVSLYSVVVLLENRSLELRTINHRASS